MKLINDKFDIGQPNISLLNIYELAKTDKKIFLSKDFVNRVVESREYLEARVKDGDDLIYGVNTGFGSLCNYQINSNQIEILQKNLMTLIKPYNL